jgi:hypothetical protein
MSEFPLSRRIPLLVSGMLKETQLPESILPLLLREADASQANIGCGVPRFSRVRVVPADPHHHAVTAGYISFPVPIDIVAEEGPEADERGKKDAV